MRQRTEGELAFEVIELFADDARKNITLLEASEILGIDALILRDLLNKLYTMGYLKLMSERVDNALYQITREGQRLFESKNTDGDSDLYSSSTGIRIGDINFSGNTGNANVNISGEVRNTNNYNPESGRVFEELFKLLSHLSDETRDEAFSYAKVLKSAVDSGDTKKIDRAKKPLIETIGGYVDISGKVIELLSKLGVF